MSYDDRLGDYNDVASRMREFFDKYPEGRLRPAAPWRVEMIGDKSFIVYEAAAYRTDGDALPGIGTAWEPFPGRTPYTRDSELMNAETSAWGRAILAVGAADTRKGIASREEVRNRQADREQEAQRPATPEQVQAYELILAELQSVTRRVDIGRVGKKATGARDKGHITPEQFHALDLAAGQKIAELGAAEVAAAEQPVEDRTAEPAAEQPAMGADEDWPDAAKPGDPG